MKARLCVLILAALCAGVVAPARSEGRQSAAKQSEQAIGVVAFENVNIVPMDRERIIEKQTVIVEDGRIKKIGPADKTAIPANARRVDGRGKYLMPGLAEMHGHLPPAQAGEKEIDTVLALFVINGVTTVRGMYGFPNHVAVRDRVARGEALGPRIYAASPALGGQNVTSADAGEKLVRDYKAAGFDLLKIHEGLSVEAYDRIVKTAREVGIPFAGHIPNAVGLTGALKAKQSTIEHLDGYIELLEADDSPVKSADPQTRAKELHKYLDERKIAALATATRDAGVWTVPTMVLYANIFSRETAEALRSREEMKYIPPQMLNQWSENRKGQLANMDPEIGRRLAEIRKKILKGLQDAGAKIMLGTDAPQLWNVPGFSIHREMQVMSEAGLTPFQILESGTRNVAVYLNTLAESGTVEVGKRADLILLEANPLESLSNVSRRAGVMVRGRWLAESELRRMLDEIATRYKGSESKQ